MLRIVSLIMILLASMSTYSLPLSPDSFSDQWDKPHTITRSTQLLIISHHKQGGDWVKQSLMQLSAQQLANPNWLYIADISGMPGIISKLIAIPRMRDYPFAVALVRDSGELDGWPKQQDQVTLIQLDNGDITQTVFCADAKQLNQQLLTLWPHH